MMSFVYASVVAMVLSGCFVCDGEVVASAWCGFFSLWSILNAISLGIHNGR